MANFPTISLAIIAKNERKNLPRLFESVKGCFHEIHVTDTGSTDGTVEWLTESGASVAGCPVFIHHFEWCNDFSKARNYAFSHVKTDYVMWLDCDDALHNKEAFIQWRDHGMQFVDNWFATYHYALDKDLKPIISFVRERVFKNSLKPTWQYPLHEGVSAKPEWSKQYITTWAVNHMRDAEDIKADKSRNLNILEEMKDYDSRMQFYYGKELYEAGKVFEAIPVLEKASLRPDIEHHDKLLAIQYGGYAAMAAATQLKDDLKDEKNAYFKRAIDLSHKGIQLEPNRAEFYVIIGDSLIQMGNLPAAVPYFAAAKHCINPKSLGSPYEGAIYSFLNCYGELPSLQLAKINFHLGRLDESKKEAQECWDKYQNTEAQNILGEIERVSGLINLDNGQPETEDIVFSCPPQSAYEFDEELYKTKGMGGSETALIEISKNLKSLTGRPVKVFNMRKDTLIADSGVEYIPNSQLNEYLSKNKPKVHIAWRHNIKITNAKTYLWCHDLVTGSVEAKQNFDKILCLTPFHKEYVKGMQGVPNEKIIVTRNGITPDKFRFHRKAKNHNKLVWMSSPDRGLDRAMYVMDEVIKEFPEAELHVYYGLDNLYKYGMHELADRLKVMMAERPYVKYHGFTEQNKMYQEVSDAVIWLHPCNFIETFCITALEMLALGVFPVTRRLGALADTLKEAEAKDMAVMLDHDCVTPGEIYNYAFEVKSALDLQKWENISFDIDKHDWRNVAREWAEMMEL